MELVYDLIKSLITINKLYAYIELEKCWSEIFAFFWQFIGGNGKVVIHNE